MTDPQLKRLVFRAGVVQTVLTAILGAVMWVYAQGKANADIVRRDELEIIKTDIRIIREDVAFIRGRLEK